MLRTSEADAPVINYLRIFSLVAAVVWWFHSFEVPPIPCWLLAALPGGHGRCRFVRYTLQNWPPNKTGKKACDTDVMTFAPSARPLHVHAAMTIHLNRESRKDPDWQI